MNKLLSRHIFKPDEVSQSSNGDIKTRDSKDTSSSTHSASEVKQEQPVILDSSVSEEE